VGDVQNGSERARALADPQSFPAIADPALQKVVKSYMRHGHLPVIPRSGARRTLLLGYLATVFDPGVKYPEAEVNDTVGAWHPDVAALRRYLVEEGFLARKDGVYWRCGGWL